MLLDKKIEYRPLSRWIAIEKYTYLALMEIHSVRLLKNMDLASEGFSRYARRKLKKKNGVGAITPGRIWRGQSIRAGRVMCGYISFPAMMCVPKH